MNHHKEENLNTSQVQKYHNINENQQTQLINSSPISSQKQRSVEREIYQDESTQDISQQGSNNQTPVKNSDKVNEQKKCHIKEKSYKQKKESKYNNRHDSKSKYIRKYSRNDSQDSFDVYHENKYYKKNNERSRSRYNSSSRRSSNRYDDDRQSGNTDRRRIRDDKKQEKNQNEFYSHYKSQIIKKSEINDTIDKQTKYENAGQFFDGFNWVDQQNLSTRTAIIYQLPLDKVSFTDQNLKEFLQFYILENRLQDSGNKNPVLNCQIDLNNRSAKVEFSSVGECKRFGLLEQIPIMYIQCRIGGVQSAFDIKQGMDKARMAALAQAAVLKSMAEIKGDLVQNKQEQYKNN